MKRVLGLDLSLTATGIYCDKCGGSVFKPKNKGMLRLDDINKEIQSHMPHIEICMIEGYSFGSRGRAIFSIGELGGTVKLMLHRINQPYIDVAPAALKKFATGKGNANKDEVLAAAIRKLSYQGNDNNECDAYVLNKMGSYHYNGGAVATSYQQEVLDKVEWIEL